MRSCRVQSIYWLGILGILWPATPFAIPVTPILEAEGVEPSEVAADVNGARAAAAETIWIADWSFDLPVGGCTEAGWVKYDNRILNDGSNYWSVNSYYAGAGSIVGNAAVLAKHDLTWVRDGYGNDWDYSIILKYQGASTLSFDYLSDSEPGFDFVTVEADSAGASESLVNYAIAPNATPADYRVALLSVAGPQSASAGPISLTDFRVSTTVHDVYIRFASDPAYSDEDGLYPTVLNAGLVVDNITVSGALTYAEDFEGALDPNVTLANTAPATPFGEWARVWKHVTDNDLCTENTTCAWLWTSHLAVFPNMAFGPGALVVRNWLDDVIVSPWVSLIQSGTGLTILSYRRFPGNDFYQGHIVQSWSVRSAVRLDNTDTSIPGDSIDVVAAWQHASNWSSLSVFRWEAMVADMSKYVDPGAIAIQLRFRVSDWQLIAAAAPPPTSNPGPGPYIDRVRIGKVRLASPSLTIMEYPSPHSAQGGFPSIRVSSSPGEDFAPTTDRFGTIDFAAASVDVYDPGFPPVPVSYNTRDSIVVVVQDGNNAGVTSVGMHGAIVAGPHAGKAPPPWNLSENGFFYVPADSACNLYGSTLAGYWFVDLDDEYFRGGDVLTYFWTATDAAGGFASLPSGLTGIPSSIAEARSATGGLLEARFLPTIDWDPAYVARVAADPSGKIAPTASEIANSHQRSCILYYQQQTTARSSGLAYRSAFMYTLDHLGYKDFYDVYFQTRANISWRLTPLAGRATPEQARGYALIIQDSGNENGYLLMSPGLLVQGPVDQQTWYRNWLAQAPSSESGRATLWLIGENFVDDARQYYGNPLVLVDMGVAWSSSSQPLLPYPGIDGQSAFTWAHGGIADFIGELLTLDTGPPCEAPRQNDGMGASGTAVVTHRYSLGSTIGEGATVMNANASASWNTILMSFAWDTLLDPPGAVAGARRPDLMAKILNGVLPDSCRRSPLVTSVADDPAALPRLTQLHGNVPNPFNPTTTIRFDLAQAGLVKLEIYDVGGRLVRTLADERLEAGWDHRVTWNGLDASGLRVASGIYLYRLVAGEIQNTRKMVVLR